MSGAGGNGKLEPIVQAQGTFDDRTTSFASDASFVSGSSAGGVPFGDRPPGPAGGSFIAEQAHRAIHQANSHRSSPGIRRTPSVYTIWNVKVYLYIQFLVLAIYGFCLGPIFDAYVLTLAHSRDYEYPNTLVGALETVRGSSALILSWPLSVLSDRLSSRVNFLRASTVLSVVGVVLMIVAVLQDHVSWLFVAIVLTALYMQTFMGCGDALLAQYVQARQRQEVMTAKGTASLLGILFGPLAQMVIISICGNEWRIPLLHTYVTAGFVLYPFLIPAFWSLTEPRAREAPALSVAPSTQPKVWTEERVLGVKKKWLCPIIIELSSLVTAIGAGMTVKFFPLFFKQNFGFTPVGVSALNCCYTLSIAIFVQVCKLLTKRLGRCQSVFLFHVTGTFCLFGLSQSYNSYLVVALFMVRGSFMNAISMINQGIVKECIHARHVSRWSALQSLSRFSWSGAAVFGGYLADLHGYRYTFFFTALMYTFSAALYAPLLLLVPRFDAHGVRQRTSSLQASLQPVPDAAAEQARKLPVPAPA